MILSVNRIQNLEWLVHFERAPQDEIKYYTLRYFSPYVWLEENIEALVIKHFII